MKRVLSSTFKGVAMKSSNWETSDITTTTSNSQPSRQLRSRSNSNACHRLNHYSFNSLFGQPDLLSSRKSSDAATATERTSSSLLTLESDEQDPVLDESNTASSRRNSPRELTTKMMPSLGRERGRFDIDLGRPVKRCSAVSFEIVNDFAAMGLTYDDTSCVANESNGDCKEDLFLSFFGVDCQ
eukprot:scaffold37268_cov23-Cyclotella_meneghiniana.AAC.2